MTLSLLCTYLLKKTIFVCCSKLSHNNLNGSIPMSFSDLPSLQRLWVSIFLNSRFLFIYVWFCNIQTWLSYGSIFECNSSHHMDRSLENNLLTGFIPANLWQKTSFTTSSRLTLLVLKSENLLINLYCFIGGLANIMTVYDWFWNLYIIYFQNALLLYVYFIFSVIFGTIHCRTFWEI